MRTMTIAGICLVLLSACAFGTKVKYDFNDIKFDVKPTQEIIVGVIDLRSYVVKGEKKENFVGLQRSGGGIPYGVVTASGRPLSDDMANSIAQALRHAGGTAKMVHLAPGSTAEDGVARLLRETGERAVLVIIMSWKSDVYGSSGNLNYSLILNVVDSDGQRLADEQTSGVRNFSSGSAWTVAAAGKYVPKIFRDLLAELFNRSSVRTALK